MATPADISKELGEYTRHGKIPGLTVLAVHQGEIVVTGASGVRKLGDPAAVTLEDKFHVGSVTKSMTATLAAILVKEGLIKWETTLAEVFPDLKMHEGFRAATLLQLCAQSGGFEGDMPDSIHQAAVAKIFKPESTQRQALVRDLLGRAPAYPPGSRHEYSNSNYIVAGAVLEKVGGKSYAQLLRERLFTPLDMTSAGFGPAASPKKVDHTWGHLPEEGKLMPIPPSLTADNPPSFTPAGRVHLSILDLAKYANFHLGLAKEAPLDADALKFLHTAVAPGDEYALGWITMERDWGGGKVLMHNGSNTMNYAVIWLAPEKKFAAMALCNSGDDSAEEVCDEVVSKVIGQVLE